MQASIVKPSPGVCKHVLKSCWAPAGPAVRACRGLRPARLQEAGGGAVLGAQREPAVRARGQAAGPVGWGEPLGLLVSSTCSLVTSMPSIMLSSACTTAMSLDHTPTLFSFRGILSAKFLFVAGTPKRHTSKAEVCTRPCREPQWCSYEAYGVSSMSAADVWPCCAAVQD